MYANVQRKKAKKANSDPVKVREPSSSSEDDGREHEVAPTEINTGFDRGIDFTDIKAELLKARDDTIKELNSLTDDTRTFNGAERKLVNRLIYITVALIQLVNGSRISEACKALTEFLKTGEIGKLVIIKLSKSETTKYDGDGEAYLTKKRHRKMTYPTRWFDNPTDKFDLMRSYLQKMKEGSLRKRVLDYLLKYHKCNTHSLRYAFINHMIYEKKNEPSLVAKMVGHSNLNQLIRYTQTKQADKLYDIDI